MSSKISDALDAFNKVSITKIDSTETFQKLLSLSPKVGSWYKAWSFEYSAFKQMPDSFKDAGVTPEEWKKIEALLPKINETKAEASRKIEVKAEEFSKYVKKTNADSLEKLQKIENDYTKILKVNSTCLSLDDQLLILGTEKDEQDNKEKELLEVLRAKLLQDKAEGNFTDPFVFGDYKDLLISD
jgi:hypothetical protein